MTTLVDTQLEDFRMIMIMIIMMIVVMMMIIIIIAGGENPWSNTAGWIPH